MLTPEQMAAIARWATFQKAITKINLYGAHYQGTASPDSDINLAIWLTGTDRAQQLSVFLQYRLRWENELTELLGAGVHIEAGSSHMATSLPAWIRDGGSVVLWEREPG
jgi:predicted nucleotidyltransferase